MVLFCDPLAIVAGKSKILKAKTMFINWYIYTVSELPENRVETTAK